MSLKIDKIETDNDGGTRMSGLFDGEPFRLMVRGGRWLFETAKGWTHMSEAHEPASRSEARGFAYGAVAIFRNQHRPV